MVPHAGDDWDEVEDIVDDAAILEASSAATELFPDNISIDGLSDDNNVEVSSSAHPWAESGSAAMNAVAAVGGEENMAASLASCLSIWPLSANALVAESLMASSGMHMEISFNGAAVDLSRSLFDGFDEGPIPKDWM